MHGARVDDGSLGSLHLHLCHERECLVRPGSEVGGQLLSLGGHVGIRPPGIEPVAEVWVGWRVFDSDRCECVRPVRSLVIKGQLPGSGEVDVDDDAFGRRDEDFVDEFLVLVMAAVCAYELHLCARDRDVEDARVRGVR